MEIISRHDVETITDITKRENSNDYAPITLALKHPNPTTQLLLTSKPLAHRPEAGLNPLVDAAAYLFSVMGKLKHIKTHANLDQLQDELVKEIRNFQETIEHNGYSANYLTEYLPISCYALCVTLDDIITSTPWGGQGKWDKYSLVNAFNQEKLSRESFLIILERLVRDPAIYIDMMEFMYICLNLGFKCHYNASESGYEQLEHIINSLYKRIRAHRGNFNKALSPYTVKPLQRSVTKASHIPAWMVIMLASGFFIALFLLSKYLLDYTLN